MHSPDPRGEGDSKNPQKSGMPPTGFEETHPPRRYPCEDEKTPMAPAWLSGLRGDIQQLVHQQDAFLVEVFICTQTAQQHAAANTTLTTRSEAHGKLHADHEVRIAKLEPELADYRSRALSPFTPRGRILPGALVGCIYHSILYRRTPY